MTEPAMTLKPCPFCGKDAEIERAGTHRQSMIVVCTWCGARLESSDETHFPAETWSWNRRTDAGREQGLADAARAAREASLPSHYRWGNDAMEQFNFGKKRAAMAIEALMEKK